MDARRDALAAVADADRETVLGEGGVTDDVAQAKRSVQQAPGIGCHVHDAPLRVDVADVGRGPQGQAQPAALTDGVASGTAVLAEHAAVVANIGSGIAQLGTFAAEEGGDIAVGDEADLLAVRLVRVGQAKRSGALADGCLRQVAERKEEVREGVGRGGPQEVGLVARGVGSHREGGAVSGVDAAGVVAGRERVTAKLTGLVAQDAEFDLSVAADTRIRGAACGVGTDEIVDDRASKWIAKVERKEGNSELVGHGARIGGFVQSTARRRPWWGVVELHEQADDLVPLGREEGSGHRGVHPATHRHCDPHRTSVAPSSRVRGFTHGRRRWPMFGRGAAPGGPMAIGGGVALPVVAIVGRPNVGTSTLFNRLAGLAKAVVHDRPGVTRDRLYEEAEIHDRHVLLVDTGGIEPERGSDLFEAMRAQTLVAIEEADVIVFLVDGRTGRTPGDDAVAALLRRSNTPVILAVNKVDGEAMEGAAVDFYGLGVDELCAVSAAHGRGIWELSDAIVARLPPPAEPRQGEGPEPDGVFDEEEDDQGDEGPVRVAQLPTETRIAVIGRPNVGKSTLVNRLLGFQRQVVDDAAGTTVDTVDTAFEVGGRRYVIVDTAGVRRKARIDDVLERTITLRSIQAIERCHLALLVLDGTEGPTDQDARLAALVADRGRGLIIVVNKWDAVREEDLSDARQVDLALDKAFPHASWAQRMFTSAKTGRGCHRLLPAVDEVFLSASRRVPTGTLNRWLERTLATHTPPQRHHHPVRLYFGTQNRVRPPTFTFFSNTPDGIDITYERFLVHRLRDTYGFDGTPIRMKFRKRRTLGEPA